MTFFGEKDPYNIFLMFTFFKILILNTNFVRKDGKIVRITVTRKATIINEVTFCLHYTYNYFILF